MIFVFLFLFSLFLFLKGKLTLLLHIFGTRAIFRDPRNLPATRDQRRLETPHRD